MVFISFLSFDSVGYASVHQCPGIGSAMGMRIHRKHKSRGFTLVELLVSVLLLGIGIVAVCQLYVVSMWTAQKAHYLSVATQRAQYELEQAEALPFAAMNLQSGTPLSQYYPTGLYTDLATGRGVQFSVSTLPQGQGTIRIESYYGYDYLVQVIVEVTWAGARQAQSTVAVATLVAKH
jgi:prepilin-type N-terminal cleavage/methylation domain-containing protein